jgi:3-methyl-2-oxobutanoate hydroxymethyltransferase
LLAARVEVDRDGGTEPDDSTDADREVRTRRPGLEFDDDREQGDQRRADDDGRDERDLHHPAVVDPVGIGRLGRFAVDRCHTTRWGRSKYASVGPALPVSDTFSGPADRLVGMRAKDIREKAGAEPITMLTAYDAPTAELVDSAGVDMILVGDSIGNLRLGYESTLPVTVEEIESATAAVARATEDAMVIADMPFLSFGADEAEAVENCGRMCKDADADAVKLECGPHTVELTRRLTQIGVPVQAHLGLTPQRENETGLFRQGTDEEAARRIVDLAERHEDAGAFSLVLEHVPANVGAAVTEALDIPTIGIGAGPECDGQVLTVDEVIGLSEGVAPFSKAFGDVRSEMRDAISGYKNAVESGEFPAAEHSHYEEDLDDVY